MGATISVAQFVRIVYKVLMTCIPDIALPYVADVGVKGSRSYYNNEEPLQSLT